MVAQGVAWPGVDAFPLGRCVALFSGQGFQLGRVSPATKSDAGESSNRGGQGGRLTPGTFGDRPKKSLGVRPKSVSTSPGGWPRVSPSDSAALTRRSALVTDWWITSSSRRNTAWPSWGANHTARAATPSNPIAIPLRYFTSLFSLPSPEHCQRGQYGPGTPAGIGHNTRRAIRCRHAHTGKNPGLPWPGLSGAIIEVCRAMLQQQFKLVDQAIGVAHPIVGHQISRFAIHNPKSPLTKSA